MHPEPADAGRREPKFLHLAVRGCQAPRVLELVACPLELTRTVKRVQSAFKEPGDLPGFVVVGCV